MFNHFVQASVMSINLQIVIWTCNHKLFIQIFNTQVIMPIVTCVDWRQFAHALVIWLVIHLLAADHLLQVQIYASYNVTNKIVCLFFFTFSSWIVSKPLYIACFRFRSISLTFHSIHRGFVFTKQPMRNGKCSSILNRTKLSRKPNFISLIFNNNLERQMYTRAR